MTQPYYPPLSDLLPTDRIPPELDVIGDALTNLLDDLYYRNLFFEKSLRGESGFYQFELVLYKSAGISIPGTNGLALLLNPSGDGTGNTIIPVEFEYKWEILKYVSQFNIESFADSARAFFELLMDMIGATEDQLLSEVLAVLVDDPNPAQKFVNDFNAKYTPAAPLNLSPPPGTDIYQHLVGQLMTASNNYDLLEVIFNDYVSDGIDFDATFDRLKKLINRWLGEITVEDLRRLLTPEFGFRLPSLTAGIRFPSNVLREVDANGDPVPDPQNNGSDKPSMLTFEVASLKYSTTGGLDFDLAESLEIDFPRSEILKSGLILEIHDLKLDLSRKSNIPEAVADGRPEDFVGVYVKDGTITFPAFWKSAPGSTGVIKARNLLIGTGGFSGTLALEALTAGTTAPVVTPLLKFTFGKDFSISLDAFSITLKQNAIKESEIEGTLVIPGFKDANDKPAEIRIKVAIRQDGDFDITGHEDDGFKTIKCGNIFDLTLKTVFLGKEDDDFYLGVAGSIKFTHNLLKEIVKDQIEIEKLIIWSDGRIEIKGGTIPLPKNIRFPIGPAELSITAIHMGSHQRIEADGSVRDFRYFGFDGGVDINPGGVDVRGKGIKFFYPVDMEPSDCYLEIKSIAIDLVIPGNASKETATLLISGFLSIGGTSADPEYEGGISFALPKVKIAGGASMKLRPKIPAFLVDAFVELSTPIPLGSTSLGIYGFRGLFGQRYVATKAAAGLQDTNTWFDYYKVKDPVTQLQGVSVSKFEGPSQTKSYDGAFSIGAGVSLATAQDSGKTFSCKLFLLLSLPDLIYLEGKANILGTRVGLTGEDPPFSAMLALSRQSVETAIGVNYKLPRDGEYKGRILDLNAEMRAAFFFQNSSAWYINFGTVEMPTTARVLSLFDATSYVMISAAGIAAGAGVTFGFNKSYAGGAVRASVGVYIKVGGFISFERPQIGGFAMLGGHVDVSLMWFSFYLVIDTSLSVEVPKPFYVQGQVHLCVGVTIGFWKFKKHIEKCFDVEFKWVKDETVDTSPVLPFKDPASAPAALPPLKATNMLSGETFDIAFLGTSLPSASAPAFAQAVLPLDSWVDLEFLKGLKPGPDVDARIGRLSGEAPANAIDYVPPAEVAHKVKHEYSIKRLEIMAWDGSSWVDYRPFQAMSPPDALDALAANPAAYKDGYWQNSGAGFNKLRLLAETSFSYMQQGQPGWYVPERFGVTSATLFCRTKLREKLCIRWEDAAVGTNYPDGAWRQTDTVLYRVIGGAGTVVAWNSHFGVARSLVFANEATAEVVLNKPCTKVDLKLTTFSTGVVIRFSKRETVGAGFVYTPVETRSLTQQQLLAQVQYDNPSEPVSKVEIDPLNADPNAVHALQVQIDALYRQLYENNPERRQTEVLLAQIRLLEEELARVESRVCKPDGIDAQTLAQQLPVLQQQVEECRSQLAALLAAQERACVQAAELRGHFERCFPRVPSTLSYEVFEESDATGHSRFRFCVYDDETNAVLLNGIERHPTATAAENAMFDALDHALRPGSYAHMLVLKPERYFFQIVDASPRFVAASPVIFNVPAQVFAFAKQVQAKLHKAYADGRFALARRVAGKLTPKDCLAHLDCWGELPVAMDTAAPDRKTAVMISARDEYCRQYDKLYRELYEYNKQLLDKATLRCEEITRALDIKSAMCRALSDQLKAISQLVGFIDKDGALRPPEGFPCSTLLHEVCCLSLEDHEFNLSVPTQEAIEEDYQSAVGAIEKMLTPVWRPDTKYCVHLRVTDTVNDSAFQDSDFYFGFRTAGPVGHFHTDPSANYMAQGKTPDQYMLTGLKGYIDYRRSYPNADGQLIGAKPLFYEDARILLFFIKRYVYHFFGDWPAYNGLPALNGNAMQVIIKDPAENVSIPNPPPPLINTTAIPRAVTSWASDDDPRIPEDVRALLNLRNPELLNPAFEGSDYCWSSGGKMITPASVYTTVTPQYLKPLKLYTAIVNNIYAGRVHEVHSFVFQTSRYPNFAAQIDSYRLDDGQGNRRAAVFHIDLALPAADVNLMFDIVAGNLSAPNAALSGTWADPFDRLIEGVLKLAPLDAAVSTEFNVVRNSATDTPVAMLIRSPEPFNDTKLPDDVLPRTLRVMGVLNPDLHYKVLFSKDRSQAFVMHPSRLIPATMKFRFAYVEWDGSKYVDRSVIVTDAVHTNI